jgi:hypothetical protein
MVIVDDITNWQLVLLYALGCAIGTMLSTLYFRLDEKRKEDLSDRLQADLNE